MSSLTDRYQRQIAQLETTLRITRELWAKDQARARELIEDKINSMKYTGPVRPILIATIAEVIHQHKPDDCGFIRCSCGWLSGYNPLIGGWTQWEQHVATILSEVAVKYFSRKGVR